MDENLSKNKISERNQKRREMLAGYFFDLSKLMCSGVVVGGLSPLKFLKWNLNNIDMEMLTIIFALASAIGAGLVIWSKTKAGQRWLESL